MNQKNVRRGIFPFVFVCHDNVLCSPSTTLSTLFSVKRRYSRSIKRELIKVMTVINVDKFSASFVISNGSRWKCCDDLPPLCLPHWPRL